jgi:putative peptide zinc metalloprotease protein
MISADALEHPQRAPEVELVGQAPDSGLTEGQWLICYGGSDYVQVTTLIYHILLYADGQTPVEEIARRVGEATQKDLSADQVRWLITNRLASFGLLVTGEPAADHTTEAHSQAPVTPPKAPLLGIRYRLPLLPYELTAPVTAVLKYLYWPPVMVAVVIAVALINGWLYFRADLGDALTTILATPELSLLVFAIGLLGNLIHELGHGSALRRAGYCYGTIGIGLLWIWPVVYTDVSHVYRLNRRQRIQVDLGGIYFNLITMIVLYIAYQLTGQAVLLASITLIGVGILREFNLFARFDGYYLVADIMGVPEPLSLVGPFLRRYVPWLSKRGKPLQLRSYARFVLVAYLLLAAADILLPFVLSRLQGEGLVALLWQSGLLRWQQLVGAWLNQGVVAKAGATLDLGLWLLIPLSLGLVALNVLRQSAQAVLALSRQR